MSRLLRAAAGIRLAAVAVGALVAVAVLAPAASAHPLGNFTVNYYEGLQLTNERVDIQTVVDAAELPSYQSIEPAVDGDRNGQFSAAEKETYAARECARLARGFHLTAGSRPVALTATTGGLELLPSSALRGLFTTRMSCELTARVDLTRRTPVTFSDHVDARYGWHEITATGTGVHVERSTVGATSDPVASTSVSDRLRHYPNNLLGTPLNVRDVRLTVAPGAGAAADGRYAVTRSNVLVRALQPLTNAFYSTASSRDLTLPVGLLALLLAIALGSGHAALPGHGKTVMAAYLVGRRGSLRDAVLVGATVTLTHTAGVLLLGLAVTLSTQFLGAETLRYLGVVSGGMIAVVGAALLRSTLRTRRAAAIRPVALIGVTAPVPASVTTGSPGQLLMLDHPHEHSHEHGQGQGHPHDHDHGHGQHGPLFSRRGLVGIGIAGGLVPSPSALVVLLSAVALGRTLFGVGLVLGYGFGMAATLMLAGLLLVRLRERLDHITRGSRFRLAERYLHAVPALTALLVLVVGLGLVYRALGSPV